MLDNGHVSDNEITAQSAAVITALHLLGSETRTPDVMNVDLLNVTFYNKTLSTVQM